MIAGLFLAYQKPVYCIFAPAYVHYTERLAAFADALNQPLASCQLASPVQRLLTFKHLANVAGRFLLFAIAQFFQKLTQGRIHRQHPGDAAIMRTAHFDAVDLQGVVLPVHVTPNRLFRLGNAAISEGQKAGEIGAISGLRRAARFNQFNDVVKLLWTGGSRICFSTMSRRPIAYALLSSRVTPANSNTRRSVFTVLLNTCAE